MIVSKVIYEKCIQKLYEFIDKAFKHSVIIQGNETKKTLLYFYNLNFFRMAFNEKAYYKREGQDIEFNLEKSYPGIIDIEKIKIEKIKYNFIKFKFYLILNFIFILIIKYIFLMFSSFYTARLAGRFYLSLSHNSR